MLLYNQRKEFLGIDQETLQELGFQNIADFQSESSDFADLFVKKPGFIHNFKNFSWIDFILHSESSDSKAIIHAKGKNYSCLLHVSAFSFSDGETGYTIDVKSIKALKGAEDLQATQDLEAAGGIQVTPVAAPTPTPSLPEPTPEIEIPSVAPSIQSEPELELPGFEESNLQELSEPDPLDIPEPNLMLNTENEFGAPSNIDFNAPLDIGDDLMMDDFAEPETPAPAIEESLSIEMPAKEEKPMLGDYVSSSSASDNQHLSELVRSGTYQYDPKVAADELGLPVDLIEEFIGDFIDQAHDFHDDLYASVKTEDFDNIQILSHKLKGVAANLRVEDAFDVLSVVNTSKDIEEITPNLNEFYKMIARLEGKEVPHPEEAVAAPAPEPTPEPIMEEPEVALSDDMEDDLTIDIKQPDDGPMLIDEEVQPIPALEDDDDLYGDLLATPDESLSMESAPMQESYDEVDTYNDLLGSPSMDEEFPSEVGTYEANVDDDLYDDLLASPQEIPQNTTPEVSMNSDVDDLEFDSQSAANELGIPLDIVNEFIQEFKEQVALHKQDFDNAISTNDVATFNKTATLLKGMSDNLRLTKVSEVLKTLQRENDLSNTAGAIAKLEAYADQL